MFDSNYSGRKRELYFLFVLWDLGQWWKVIAVKGRSPGVACTFARSPGVCAHMDVHYHGRGSIDLHAPRHGMSSSLRHALLGACFSAQEHDPRHTLLGMILGCVCLGDMHLRDACCPRYETHTSRRRVLLCFCSTSRRSILLDVHP